MSIKLHETSTHRIERDPMGYYTIMRLADGESVYQQGDDATVVEDSFGIDDHGNLSDTAIKYFDRLCEDFLP